MNRFSIVTLVAAAAAAVLATAPAHAAPGAGEGTPGYPHESVQAAGSPAASRAEVRAQAARAVAEGLVASTEAGLAAQPAGSVLNRAAVRAEAAEAVRLGLVAQGEQAVVYTASQLAALKAAADRATTIVVAGQR